MSRGPGRIESAILVALEDGSPQTQESLRWALCEPKDGDLTTAWNTSFARAVRTLETKGLILTTKRRLESFQECVDHYPGKTHFLEARKIRIELLPVLQEWIEGKNGISPRYQTEENEAFQIEALPADEIADLRAKWKLLQEDLRPVYGISPPSAAPKLLRLICKGQSLFDAEIPFPEISARGAFSSLLDEIVRDGILPSPLEERLKQFLLGVFPPFLLKSLKFKSYILRFADVPSRGNCELNSRTVAHLFEHRPDFIKGLKGFDPVPARHPVWPDDARHTFPPALYRLFDQKVFGDFTFLTLPDQPTDCAE